MESQHRLIDTYVAAPYSHDDPAVRELRFRKINAYCAAQMAAGVILYSPISHCHPIAFEHALPTDWAFWERFDRAMIGCCQRLTVLTLDGWRESRGVQAEIKIALDMNIPVEYALEADAIPALAEREEPAAGVRTAVEATLRCAELVEENRKLHVRIARLTDPDAQIAHVRNARRAAAGVIAALERRIEKLEAAAEPAGTVTMVGITSSAGALVSGLHVLASDAWSEFQSGARTCLESAWQDGYRDTPYRCRPECAADARGRGAGQGRK